VACIGQGDITITVSHVGEFPLECSAAADTTSIRNEFDVRYARRPISITVHGLAGQRWAVSAAESVVRPGP
jgi:hypothetical protein